MGGVDLIGHRCPLRRRGSWCCRGNRRAKAARRHYLECVIAAQFRGAVDRKNDNRKAGVAWNGELKRLKERREATTKTGITQVTRRIGDVSRYKRRQESRDLIVRIRLRIYSQRR